VTESEVFLQFCIVVAERKSVSLPAFIDSKKTLTYIRLSKYGNAVSTP